MHQHIIMKKDDHETAKEPEELVGLNRMMFEIYNKESYRVNYCVDTRYNNMISYHNDMESKITIGQFTKIDKKNSCSDNQNVCWKVELKRF